MRTVFCSDKNGSINQRILSLKDLNFTIDQEDFSKSKNVKDLLASYIKEDRNRAFDLENGPLLRTSIIKIASDKYIFYYNMHHIISDGWSMNIVKRDILAYYEFFAHGTEISLPELRIQYKDYAAWQLQQFSEEPFLKAKQYWLNKLSGDLPTIELPSQKRRPNIKTYNGRTLKTFLAKEQVSNLNQFTREQDGTLFISLLGIWNVLLYKYTLEKDIIIGSPVAGRDHIDLENQIGFFVNTLALRNEIDPEESFQTLYSKIKENTLKALENQIYPFDRLVEDLNIAKDTSRNPVFDIMLILQNTGEKSEESTPKHESEIIEEFTSTLSKFDLEIICKEVDEDLMLQINYNTDVYDTDTVRDLIINFKLLLTALISKSESHIGDVEYLSDNQVERILGFNDTKIAYPRDETIIELFEEQVKKTPDHIALVFEDKKYSYQELNKLSNQFGAYLREEYDVKVEDLIGIKLERSEKLIVAILGILKSGAAYVPIDPNFPQDRIDFIKNDTQSKVIFDEEEFSKFSIQSTEYSDENLKNINSPTDLVYVIYTSGTTGNPKGVMVEHKNVVRLVKPCSYFTLDTENILLSTGAISFDATILEYFGTLLNGAKLVLATQDNLLQIDKLKEVINTNEVDSFWMTASWFSFVVDSDIEVFRNVNKIIVGGDVVSPHHVKKLYNSFPDIEITNGYGPTENTTFSLTYPISHSDYTTIPLGKPISNSTAYILDEELHLVPVGVAGKIYVSGDGVARGYLNRDDLTSEKFMDNPFEEGLRMYDTGDLGRWLPDGNIEYLGRIDDQVKIRGYRVELGEIASRLLESSAALKQAVVAAQGESSDKYLVAYYVCDDKVDKKDLKSRLSEVLPEYMVPNYYVELENIPLTTNGKADIKALPSISSEDMIRKEYVSPVTSVEKELVAIWEEVLKLEKVGITDNFFELGGHSLIVSQVINRIQKQLGSSVSYKDFFTEPTIEGLSKKMFDSGYLSIPLAPVSQSYPLTSSQRRFWILSQLDGGSIAYNMPVTIRLKGDLNLQKFQESFTILLNRHEILRTSFRFTEDKEISQFITEADALNFSVKYSDFSLNEDKENAILNYLKSENSIAFNLEQAPLVRASILKRQEQDFVFFISMHHIIGDGWSMELMVKEVVAIYNSLIEGKIIDLPVEKIQYKDYSVWINDVIQKEKYQSSEKYWLEQFQGELPVLNLPSFKARPLTKTFNGTSSNKLFSKEFGDNINQFSKDHNATLFMTLLAGIKVLLHKYSGQNDIIIGTPVAGRDHPDLENQIGLYLNTLAVRSTVYENDNFLKVLDKEKEALLGAYEHQSYPFDDLVGKLNLKRDTSRSALFDVLVVLQNQGQLKTIAREEELTGLKVENYAFEDNTTQFDLSFIFVEREAGLSLTIRYNTDIYDSLLVDGIFDHFENIINRSIVGPSISLEGIDYLTTEEKGVLLHDFNDTTVDFDREKTIIEIFEEQVEKTPDSIAVVFEDQPFTYRQINEEANRLGIYLREKYSIQPDDLIAIKLDKSERVTIAVLAILKSGGAYVPIDVNYPEERIQYMENDSKSKAIIDEAEFTAFYAERDQYSASNPKKNSASNNLAYIIYTSGTTGNPKGVMVENRNLVSRMSYYKSFFTLSES
ncbi:amino acid adenylation domain-containing protein, partial [Chryseobacterium proteolyticum]|uniref:amino acid adenylation domain-containing protein n=1 Tax=Chryseobacterium proteolyticum TaxID=118127 RepID=UPI00398311F4